ncbi:MAG TPA: glycerophosphodiester phosphodiesterase family protein [Acidobacteriaceae bacterium]|jgi:glycerophosphoryl diester phosphodiesterase|nr:glycerophosphodiester phosphodiesterase family protein [Acidobacteriaceae bacterium]
MAAFALGFLLPAAARIHAQSPRPENNQPKRVELLCHRTANEDIPENTLESLEQAALLGCDVVEIDLRGTLDGQIVLNHDGVLDRLTDGFGEMEQTYYGDLALRDVGSWMGDRFDGLHIALFEDALRLARQRNIRLILDMKTKGIGPEVLALLRQENMLDRVRFGGEWDDVQQLYPEANAGDSSKWVQPGVTTAQVEQLHRQGLRVIANFSANDHEMDLAGMQSAVAAGVDGINVDYPRLGADAVGRSVEAKLRALTRVADAGDATARATAILELSRYRGFALQSDFVRWLQDADDHVSRAAALALITARPETQAAAFSDALRSAHADARANAAWALGILHAPASTLVPILHDPDPVVLREVLLALSRMPGPVPGREILPLLTHADLRVRGAAALTLARHDPELALRVLPVRMRVEIDAQRGIADDYIRRGQPQLTAAEIEVFQAHFAVQMKLVQALAMLRGKDAIGEMEALAFRPGNDYSQLDAAVAAFHLWDRIGSDPQAAVVQLAAPDTGVADRAEWMLVKGGPSVLPEVRKALRSDNAAVPTRAMRIVAWQGDQNALDALHTIANSQSADAPVAKWAIAKIQTSSDTVGLRRKSESALRDVRR